MPNERKNRYKWIILLFLMLIYFLIFTQMFAMPVFFQMIGSELNLSIAMLGFIWGMWTLGGVFFALPGGLLGDILGVRIVIFVISLILAIVCGLRGLATGAVFLSAMMFIGGGCFGSILANAPKTIFMWFPPVQLGLANGLLWAASIVGAAVGAGISATIVAPALGGWQNALFLYAIILIIATFGWLLVGREPEQGIPLRVPFAEAMSKTIRTKEVWLCTVAYFGLTGVYMGFGGYLPIYLQNIGWKVTTSSASLTVFMLVSILTSVLLSSLSDRFGGRKVFFIVSSFVYLIAVGMVALFKAPTPLWVLFVIGGLGFGPTLPILNSVITEIKGVGAKYAGTAIGIAGAVGGLGGWIFSTIGGHLATVDQTLPFIFCSIFFLICLVPFFFIKGTK
jgi:NNP family nitrate/nitrite transporter-like MFS transporter